STDPTDPDVVKATICTGYTMSYTTLRMNGTGVVDGLTIKDSDNDAVRCEGGTPTIRRCIISGGLDQIISVWGGCDAIFEANEVYFGGMAPAIRVFGNAAPTFRNNYMHNNTGGSIDCDAESHVTVDGNRFVTSWGGSMLTLYQGHVTNNVFRLCKGVDGGAISVKKQTSADDVVEIMNNLIVGCTAKRGGGIYCAGNAAIENNTLCDNSASNANGGANIFSDNAAPIIRNCLLAFGKAGGGLAMIGGNRPNVSYCDLFGNVGGDRIGEPGLDMANLSIEPVLADRSPEAGSYRLKSKAGRWLGWTWVIDPTTSPLIDAGDPASVFSREPSPNGGRINIGYDGNTEQASKSGASPVPSVIVCAPRGSGTPVTANLVARFSVPMKQGSVAENLYINGVKATGWAFVWVGTKMTYKPPESFKPGRRYQIRIARTAMSKAGVRMAADKIWNFTVAASAPANVSVTALRAPSGTQLAVNLAAPAEVTVTIRNLAGREIALLSPGALEAGVHSLVWNGKSRAGTLAPAGSYLVQVQAKDAMGAKCSALAVLKR
ncbi:MAG: right-handed parallel beta-helix repeat-containing protein, partial [Bacteroidota bacterium]